jgi:hypothetical protein
MVQVTMSTFKDGTGRDWKLELNIGLIEDIHDATGIMIDDLIKDTEKFADVTFNNPRRLVEVLYVMCEEQIKRVPLTPKEFGRLFDRTTIDAACNAFMESVVLFYPRASVGNVLRNNLPTVLAKMDQQLAEKAETSLKEALSNMPTN